jgi:hypothetical protein
MSNRSVGGERKVKRSGVGVFVRGGHPSTKHYTLISSTLAACRSMEPTEDVGYDNNRGRGPTPVAKEQREHDQSFCVETFGTSDSSETAAAANPAPVHARHSPSTNPVIVLYLAFCRHLSTDNQPFHTNSMFPELYVLPMPGPMEPGIRSRPPIPWEPSPTGHWGT